MFRHIGVVGRIKLWYMLTIACVLQYIRRLVSAVDSVSETGDVHVFKRVCVAPSIAEG